MSNGADARQDPGWAVCRMMDERDREGEGMRLPPGMTPGQWVDHLAAEIDRLATFIIEEVPGEPSRSEGAVDCAIRVIRDLMQGARALKPSRGRPAKLPPPEEIIEGAPYACPHCHPAREIEAHALRCDGSNIAEGYRSTTKKLPPLEEIIEGAPHTCPHCRQVYPAREIEAHALRCDGSNIARPRAYERATRP